MSGLRSFFRTLVRKSFWATCLYYFLDDWLASHRFAKGNITTKSGTLHTSLELETSVSYIQEVLADYLHYSECSGFVGKVAEVGPGDNCGVGLLLLAGGCQSVDLVDRFFSHRDPAHQAAIYQELGRIHPGVARLLKGADLLEEGQFPGIHRWYGERASAELFFDEGQDYDVILSRAVLEHVRDPLLALQRMAVALKPGGLLLHKVDLQDHGMFSEHHSELTWFEVPAPFYNRMSRASGRPNRVLYHQYRSLLATLPMEAKLLITRLASVGEITPHVPYEQIPFPIRERAMKFVATRREHFCEEIRNASLADLSVAGFFLVGRKCKQGTELVEKLASCETSGSSIPAL